jgi:hypothetical protein
MVYKPGLCNNAGGYKCSHYTGLCDAQQLSKSTELRVVENFNPLHVMCLHTPHHCSRQLSPGAR